MRGGNSVTVAAENGDVVSHGAQIAAGRDANGLPTGGSGDVSLAAGRDIALTGVQARSGSTTDSRSASAGFGVGVSLNAATGVSVGLTGHAAMAAGSSRSSASVVLDSHVSGTGDVALRSGRDTTLAGAVVSGARVTAKAGRDLAIASVADAGSQSSKSVSGSLSIGGGNSLISGIEVAGSKGSGKTKWISEQSGLVSEGAMDVTVGHNTDLDAGKIVSDTGQLKLDTGTLTYRNADGARRYRSVGADLGLDLSGKTDAAGGSSANETLQGSYRLDDTEQRVRATVGPGEIVSRDGEKQASLEAGGATAPLSGLNRDPGRASTITRDRHVNVDAYVSSDSLKAAAKAGKSVADALAAAFRRMRADGKLSPGDLRAAIALSRYADDPAVIAELKSCGEKHSEAGFHFLDLVFTPAHASGAGCLISVAGETFTITPSGALTCLATFERATALTVDVAERAATPAIVTAMAIALTPTTAGGAIDATRTLSDGTRIHVTGEADELTRHVTVTLPDGGQASLVLTRTTTGYELTTGTIYGDAMSPVMLDTMAETLSSDGQPQRQRPGARRRGEVLKLLENRKGVHPVDADSNELDRLPPIGSARDTPHEQENTGFHAHSAILARSHRGTACLAGRS